MDSDTTFNINFLWTLFIIFFLSFAIYGCLLCTIESRLPAFMRQAFRYGKHSYKGNANYFISKLEVPKSWFKHFYAFAFAWSLLALSIMLKGFFLKEPAPEFVMSFLDYIAGGSRRKVQINSTWGLITLSLMTLQCGRRFYETWFMQVFSSHSKINICHYIAGFGHYFGVILALVANTEGFVRGTTPTAFSLSKSTIMQYLCVFIFYFSWSNQYKTNKILASMRKDANGKVITERHFLPTGGFFGLLSSPHMFFELAMYKAILAMIPNCMTWYFITFWVTANQVTMAHLTHQWYKQTYKNYPKDRYAIIPYLI